ncbi:MAG: lipoyl(octanoyl) transferase LipB [candidate division WOR-3 bacterium]
MEGEKRPAWCVELDRVEFGRALELQRAVWELRRNNEIPDTLILLEHPPVITLGRAARRENLLVSESELKRRGCGLYRTDRGGDITFHGPGQLVGYPIFSLREGLAGVRHFVEALEETLIQALAQLGVRAQKRPGYVGVWVDERKIASIGIAVRHGVSLHGFALNVTVDLSCFQLVRPCGLAGVVMTSVQQEGGRTVNVREAVRRAFEVVFGISFQSNLPLSLASLTKGLSTATIASALARE